MILDEAYAEFADTTHLDLAATGRVLVVRTMSKAFGLAGLRVGYAVGESALVAEVEKSRGPYKVSMVAERAAIAALTEDGEWVSDRVAAAHESREWLAGTLRALELTPLPSQANFICVPIAGAPAIARRMRAMGVAVRAFEALPNVGDALRITVGPAPMMREAVAALEKALSCA